MAFDINSLNAPDTGLNIYGAAPKASSFSFQPLPTTNKSVAGLVSDLTAPSYQPGWVPSGLANNGQTMYVPPPAPTVLPNSTTTTKGYDPFTVGKNIGTPTIARAPVSTTKTGGTPAPTPLINPPGALYDRNTGAPINPGSVADIQAGYHLNLSPEEQAAHDAAAAYLRNNTADANQAIDPNAIYQNNLGMFQGQIDAVNKIYADRLNQARIQGQGRIESRQFSQGRSGQIGSGTGEAGVNAVQDANTQVENSIRDEQSVAIGTIMGQVRSAALQETKDKTAAKKAGADALLSYYDNAPTRKATALKPVIATLVSKGIDPSKMTPEDLASITNGLGVSKEDIFSAYKDGITARTTAKTAADKATAENEKLVAETAKTKAETTMVGKMTPAQKADLAEKIREFGATQAMEIWKTKYTTDNKPVTAESVKTHINQQMATPEFKGMTKEQKQDFILVNGGTPSDYGY